MPDNDLSKEMWAFGGKIYVWVCYIAIGIVAHIANMLLSNRKRKWYQEVASVVLAGFVGYLATVFCMAYHLSTFQGGLIVPAATMSSEKIVKVIMAIDWMRIAKAFLNIQDKE